MSTPPARENTALGSYAGDNVTTGKRNVIIGYTAGNITTGDNNIIIGYATAAPTATASNQLNIGNTLYGDLSGKYLGINATAPTSRLTISGPDGAPDVDRPKCRGAQHRQSWFVGFGFHD